MTEQSRRNTPEYLILGEILRPHGVRGEVRMKIITDYPERLKQMNAVYLGKDPYSDDIRKIDLISARLHQQYVLLTFKNYNDRDKADELRGLFVMIDLENAVPLEDGEYYLFELIGLNVQTHDGIPLGTLKEILETGANDVYIIDSPKYGELLVPAHDETLVSIDFDDKVITVKLPEGLLPSS